MRSEDRREVRIPGPAKRTEETEVLEKKNQTKTVILEE